MAGKFEAPKGKKGNIPEYTEAKPGRKDIAPKNLPEKAAAEPAPAEAPMEFVPQISKVTPKKKPNFLAIALIAVDIVLVCAIGFMGVKIAGILRTRPEGMHMALPNMQDGHAEEVTEATTAEPPTEPEPERVVATASLAAVGDLLMHKPVIQSGYNGAENTYDFSSIFKYLAPTIGSYDISVANLETTLAGSAKPYQGNPYFNCPDQIVKDAQSAGFDILLTANNHCFDTGMDGYLRTLEVTREAGMDTIGTMASPDDPKYLIKDINGIRFGLICYTYEHPGSQPDFPSLNGLPMYGGSYDMINSFDPKKPERMYDEIRDMMMQMKEQGVEATVLFIHWGTEMVLKTDKQQPIIAQGLANLGIDVIIGGHPHVVEPMQLLENANDPAHKTVCIYSLGNAVSNQRLGNLANMSTAHTEDGALFTVTFEKYSDGKVYMLDTNVIPMWVNMRTQGAREYNILPLDADKRDAWKAAFDLTDTMLNTCDKSYKRTMDIVGSGLEACREYLYEQKEAREDYYYDLAFHPEKFATAAPVEIAVTDTTLPETAAAAATLPDAA